jgi:acetyl esterase/lipase
MMSNTPVNLAKSAIWLILYFIAASGMAQDGTIYPLETPNEPNAIPLKTGGVEDQPAPETWFRQWGDPMARNISKATLTPFLPDPEKSNGTTVIVAPGGGFKWLSMGNEGWEVAEALAEQGIIAFVLKYRLRPTPLAMEDFREFMNSPMPRPKNSSNDDEDSQQNLMSFDLSDQLEDAEVAYDLIIERAGEWGVDPEKIGMMGFSAGAGLTMHSTLNSETMDLAFIAPIYGSMEAVEVPEDAPPMFNVIATDDFLFHGDMGIVQSWHKAGKPVEFHLYQNGGHGFGLGNPDRTSNRWFDTFIYWLEVNKFLASTTGE